jgi:predicted MFS family arabinose efflux permease
MNRPKVNKWVITASVMIPTLMEILDTSVANVALNHIQGSLSAAQEEVTWVLTSCLVANAVVIPMSGRLARFMTYSFIFDPPYQQRRKKGERVDYIGLTLLCLGLGSLQMVLDKGQLADWFNSDFILFFATVVALSILLFVFWELRQENPVLDLRIFKNATFATGNAVLFVGFFSFFGSIFLLPIYLQTLLGYTA